MKTRVRPVDLFLQPGEVYVSTAADGSRWATDRRVVVRLDHPVPTVLDTLAGLEDGVWEIRAVKPPVQVSDASVSLGPILDQDWSSAQAVYLSPWILLGGHSEQLQYRPLVTSHSGDEVAAVVDGRLLGAVTGARPDRSATDMDFRPSGRQSGAGVVRITVHPAHGEPYVMAYLMTIVFGATVTLPVIPEGVLL